MVSRRLFFNFRRHSQLIGMLIIPLVASFMALPLRSGQPVQTSQSSQSQPQQVALDPRELECDIRDGFTLAAVGDLLLAQPVSMIEDPGFQSVLKIFRQADVAFGNFEGTAIDIRHFNGYPQAENGGNYLIDSPQVPKDIRQMGFSVVSRANNHTTDWGIEGMQETDRLLDEAGVVHAGTGRNMPDARAARFLATPKGRIGIVSMNSSYTPMSRAMAASGEAMGRPGVDALRTTQYLLVTEEMMQNLRGIRDALPKGAVLPPREKEKPNELALMGVHYRVGDHVDFTYDMNPIDLREILQSIRQGKEISDFVIATNHGHEPGNWSRYPPNFLPTLAHAAIDNGADEFVNHGPHQLRGIEIYKGKPIFYSLGNFFFQVSPHVPQALDEYEQFKADPAAVTGAELNDILMKSWFKGDEWYQSVIAVSRFDHGQVSEIRLYPVELAASARDANRGIPHLADSSVAHTVLERLQELSKPYGTIIKIEGNVGVIYPTAEFR